MPPDAPSTPQTFQDFMISQTRTNIERDMETATMTGDVARVKKLAADLAKLDNHAAAPPVAAVTNVADAPKKWGVDEARTELRKLATWFGKDPERTEAAFNAAKFLDMDTFKDAAEYATAVKKFVEKKIKSDEDDEPPAETSEDDAPPENDEPPAENGRRRTPPASNGGAAQSGRRAPPAPGVPTKLSQVPDVKQRETMRRMMHRNKIDEATIVKNWYEIEQSKKARARAK